MDLRGGCSGMPVELTGEFDGYNNAATMRVGLWITKDARHYGAARAAAAGGPLALREHLAEVMATAAPFSPANAAWVAVSWGPGQGESQVREIDWAQLCFDLVLEEPSDHEMDLAHVELLRQDNEEPGEKACWERAYATKIEAAWKIALIGVPA